MRADFLQQDDPDAQSALADEPDTVEFDLDSDGLQTSSLGSVELELAPASQDAPDAADIAQNIPEPGPTAMEPGSTEASSAVQPPRNDLRQATREIGPGTVLRHRYLLEKPLGVGGSSTVFSAIDRHRSGSSGAYGRVAVKVLHPRFREDKARVYRLIREFRHMQRLTHAGVARVFDLDCDDGVWFITMQLLEGQSLHRHLKGGLKEGEALRILTQCTEALAYAHDQGVMHGDLKPGNIFITEDGSVRLLDFGSVPDRNEAAATDRPPPNLAATLAYASPQMLEEKDIDPRDDLFSLGCVAYELFSGGQHPFDRKSSLEARRQNLRPADTRAIQVRQFAVIAQMLAWERAARPASARDFLQAFLTADFPTEVSQETMPSPSGAALKSVSAADSALADANAALPSDGAPTGPEPAVNAGSEIHLDVGVETHPADAAKPDSGSSDSVRADATPADLPPDRAAIEHTFAKFSGVVPDEWSGPGARLPTVSRPQLRPADLPEIKPAGSISDRADRNRSGLNRTGPSAAASRQADSTTPWIWSRKTALIAVPLVALAAAIFLSRLWQPEPSTPVPTAPAPAPAATTTQPEAIAPPVPPPTTIVQPSPEPALPATKSLTKAPGPAAAAAPPPSSLASFQSALIQVGSSQQMAVVNIVREKSTAGSARVAWTIVADTATPGVDYETPDSPIVRFNDGQRVRSLYIPIKHPTGDGTARGERRFTVTLQKTAGGLPPGRIARAEVVIGAQ